MIPRIIHYVWLGGTPLPAKLQQYMHTWQQQMPGWEVRDWTEETIAAHCEATGQLNPLAFSTYCRQAYEAGKYAFASDYIRLWALEQFGGVYLDTDVEIIRPFDELQEFQNTCDTSDNSTQVLGDCTSFIGFEESKAKTLGTNVIGCAPHCAWVQEMLQYYETHAFIVNENENQKYDMTPNSELIARLLTKHGLVRNGVEQVVKYSTPITTNEPPMEDQYIHIYDFHHFSPITSTRVMRKTKDTFSIHHCYGSWTEGSAGSRLRNSLVVRELINALIQLKRFYYTRIFKNR